MTAHAKWNNRRLWRDTRGITLVLVALTISILIGFASLGAETGLWFAIKRQNQSAADAGAMSAAYEIIYDLANGITPTSANLTPAANQAAAQNNYTGAAVVTYPYSDAIVTSAVSVTLQTTQAASLASLFLPSVVITTNAVARVAVLDSPCILALNPTAPNAIDLQGSVTVNAPGCSVVADSNSSSAIHIQGSASITAATLVTPGDISYTGGAFTLNSTPLVGSAASFVPDPFTTNPNHATLTSGMPPITPACVGTGTNPVNYNGNCSINSTSLPNSDVNLSAITRIAGTLRVQNQTVNLAPGTYWITDGNLDIRSNGHMTCTACTPTAGVTTILTTTNTTSGTIGTVLMNSNSSMTLNAPSTGTFAGILIMQDKPSTIGAGVTYISSSASFQGGPSSSISGLLYLPHEAVTLQGNPNTTCALIIADTVVMKGNPTLTLAGCPTSLTDKITVKTAVLAE
jgi:hypothetical protein